MEFWKMNGAGNDFIILNDMDRRIPDGDISRIAAKVCHRHMSVGADGLMVVRPAEQGGDYRMLFYNADGSEAEMCGNGARCICRFGYENGLAGEVQRVETASGTVTGRRIDARRYQVRLNSPTVLKADMAVEVDGVTYPCAYVELGSPGLPHAAVPYDGLRESEENALRDLGRKLRYHPAFPKGANVNFYELTGEDHAYERTYERGVEDSTYACGTGTASVALALTVQGKLKSGVLTADMAGGTLEVAVRPEDGTYGLYLTGPTNIVCKGQLTDEELDLE